MIEERRAHRRIKQQLILKIADDGFDIITESANISPAGTYCRVTRYLPVMTKIEVALLVPVKGNRHRQAKKIKCKGVVVRIEPVILEDTDRAHYNVAIFFTDISPRDQKIIESYVNSGTHDNQNERMDIEKTLWKQKS